MSDRRHSPIKRKKNSSQEESAVKRKKNSDNDIRPLCKYGELCYQKNPLHTAKFRHPHREKTDDEEANESSSTVEAKTVEIKSATESSPECCEKTNEEKEKTTETVDTSHSAGECSQNQVEDLPDSPSDVRENIKQKFLFEMPDDFYQLWEFCKNIQSEDPCGALKENIGLKLVGPFQLLDGSLKPHSRKLSEYLTQWRFYYDPPEFQTIAVGDSKDGFHLGYFRDDPKEMPAFVASNAESKGCIITPLADNIFAALCRVISEKLKKANPFQKANLTAFRTRLTEWATEHEIPIQSAKSEQNIKERKKKVVAKTFYGCGMVVPYDRKTDLGYREIPESDASLKKILKKIVESKNATERDQHFDPLQELVNNVQYANDEMDWGMGLELGWDLLAFGGESLHSTVSHLLGVAYELLERQQFTVILKAHLNNRRHLSNNYTI